MSRSKSGSSVERKSPRVRVYLPALLFIDPASEKHLATLITDLSLKGIGLRIPTVLSSEFKIKVGTNVTFEWAPVPTMSKMTWGAKISRKSRSEVGLSFDHRKLSLKQQHLLLRLIHFHLKS